jgi:uncharacterized protein (TIGR01244 family)
MKRFAVAPFAVIIFLFIAGPGGPAASAGPQDRIQYVCSPCGCRGDDVLSDKPGSCGTCGMDLVDLASTLTLDAVPGFYRASDSVWVAGQPTLGQLDAVGKAGAKAILNLRLRSEHDAAAESTKARRLGMAYVGVPVDFDDPKSADVDAFLAATDTLAARGPVLIHCAAAIRVASFWMVRRVVRDGWTYERAREEARRISLRRDGEWVEFAKKEIERRKGEGR